MKHGLILLFLMSWCYSSFAQNSFTLEQAMEYAEKHHLNRVLAEKDIEDAKLQIKETSAVGYPQLNGEITFTHYLKLQPTTFPETFLNPAGDPSKIVKGPAFGTKNNFSGSLNLTQLIFDYTYLIGLEAARKLKDLRNVQLEYTTQEIRKNVREAYIGTYIVQIGEETIQKNVESLEKILFETKALYKSGFVEQLDIDRLELSLANLAIESQKLKEQTKILMNVLKFQMGYPMGMELEIADDLKELEQEALQAGVSADPIDLSKRKEFQIFDSRLEINSINIRRLKAEQYPSLAGYGSYNLALVGNKLINSGQAFWLPSSFVGLQVNVPIFDGFRNKRSIQRAQIAYDKIDLEMEAVKRGVILEISNAKVNYSNALQNLVSTKNNIGLAEKIYNTAKIKYKEGVGSSLEITQAEQSLYQSQSNYNRALYDLLVAKAQLDNAMGL